MKLKSWLLSIILIFTVLLAACSSDTTKSTQQDKEAQKIRVYTTLYPLEDFTKKIGGSFVDVESIIPPGSDAHTFEPTTKQMINIAEAHLFIYNGLGMESYAEAVAEAVEKEDVLIVEAAAGVETIEHTHDDHAHEEDGHGSEGENEHSDEEHGHDEDEHTEEEHGANENEDHGHADQDPHVWLDPYKSITLAENIKNALVEVMPEQKEEFENNFAQLKKKLEELDGEFHDLIKNKEEPEIIVSHAAYGYWEESYGLKQIAVAGLSPTDEPSQKELQAIVELAKKQNFKYVIFEQNVTTDVAEVIRKEINAKPLQLHNLSVLTAEDIENQEDYFTLMRKNLETLKTALK